MRQIRQISKNQITLAFVLIAFLFFSCGREIARPEIEKITGKDLMTAIYFLDGNLIDSIEPLKELKMENLFQGNTELVNEIRGNISQVLDQIEGTYPGTFATFKRDITSGNHVIINESLAKNAQLIHDVLKISNKQNVAISTLIDDGQQPLAEVISEYFPNSKDELTATQVKDVVQSDAFKKDISSYFKDLEGKINGRNNQVQEQMCAIVIGAAVLVVAAIAIAVIYAVVVLNVLHTAHLIGYIWGDTERSSGNSSLLRDQIINSIATNFSNYSGI